MAASIYKIKQIINRLAVEKSRNKIAVTFIDAQSSFSLPRSLRILIQLIVNEIGFIIIAFMITHSIMFNAHSMQNRLI